MSGFEHDLFISYAHIDNQPLTAEQEGWISRFHVSLNALLSMRLGKKARIWRDDKLQGNDVFADEIVERFGSTAVLLSVLSPRYLKSRWCTREVTEFCARAETSGGVLVSNRARVFKVLKTPVPSEEPLPPLMRSLLGYEFFTMEEGTPLELDAAYGEKYAQDFNRKVNKLAYEIAQLLTALEEESAADPDPASPADDAGADTLTDGAHRIYLAECSFDRKEEREMLQAELTRLGHEVLPERHLPRDEADYVAAVDELLGRCDLSVHLIGAHAGAVADGPSGRSVAEWQNELAARRAAENGLRRLVWLPAGTAGAEPRQQAFIDALHEDGEVQRGADLLTGGLESLKRAVSAALSCTVEPAQAPARDAGRNEAGADGESRPADESCAIVHLLCTPEDRKSTVPLRRALKSRGVEATLPAFVGDAAEVRAANRRLLDRCDAVLLYYGHGDEAWKRTADSELRKLPVLRGDGRMPPIHTCLAAPSTFDKEDLLEMGEEHLVDALDGLVEASLAPLFDRVGVERGEPA